MKIALVTGTSTGIGLETAVLAEQAGYTVVATMRDTGKAGPLRERLPGADVRRLDVTDPDSVADCVAAVIADHGQLDALINNAGAGHVGTIELESVDAVRDVMEVNFFGVVQVTKAALPHLRAARGRLITVTSVGGVIGQPFNEAYCAAKFAVEGWMESLAPVVGRLGVAVSVIEPGAVATEFVSNIRAGSDLEALVAEAGDYRPLIGAYLDRTATSFSAAQSAHACAQVVVAALTADEPRFRYQTSEQAAAFTGVKLADADGSALQKLTTAWLGE
ncbi:SDR family oxidoreductase [Streptomyces sp. NPDC021080]|uniref:SDR family oxidoreductase n=1 Tax=Streptomyces sp. NPDC021080 TaxID=3365110 RepID=UPI0037901587